MLCMITIVLTYILCIFWTELNIIDYSGLEFNLPIFYVDLFFLLSLSRRQKRIGEQFALLGAVN